MDQRLERLEQMQREMQDQLQIQMQEQLAKIQQDMRDQMLESQRSMMSQLTELLAGGLEKGKSPTGTSAPINFPACSGFNPRDNPVNPVVPDLDDIAEMGKPRVELPQQQKDRCKWLEEKFKTLESANYYCGIDAKKLSLVPYLVFPP
ncbi:putative DNA double-strand break repair Rad50 ATPase [Gossypium australe]|uniref:Putative DNA double-strand break repair Rad50 ATPase n=1 Tax=Gossypium australe TaxID=47621 RepID=A0A5B6UVF7_9ROSI|nr:putative DNA double-strand break repair Rad50 ATPase [Gossypium australe]